MAVASTEGATNASTSSLGAKLQWWTNLHMEVGIDSLLVNEYGFSRRRQPGQPGQLCDSLHVLAEVDLSPQKILGLLGHVKRTSFQPSLLESASRPTTCEVVCVSKLELCL